MIDDVWGVVALTILVVAACVALFYEALGLMTKYLPRARRLHRMRVVLLIVILLAAQIAQVWLYCGGILLR